MKKILTIILATSLLVACAEDFTEIDPVGALSDASLQNATGVDLLLTGAYSSDALTEPAPNAAFTPDLSAPLFRISVTRTNVSF